MRRSKMAQKGSVGNEQKALAVEGKAEMISKFTVTPGTFVSELESCFKDSLEKLSPVDMASGEYVITNSESEPEPSISALCESEIQKMLADPSHPGTFKLHVWEQDEAPGPGQEPALYKLRDAIIPVSALSSSRS